MSTCKAEVVPVTLQPHPNADTLSLVPIFGFTAIVRTAEFQGRDRGVYIPVDAIVPDRPEYAFLDGHRRIKAKRLRGVFSMGLLMPAPDGAEIGDDLTTWTGIVKYEPPADIAPGEFAAEAPSGLAPCYTDIESLRRYCNVLQPGEPVIVTEKIEGENARFTLRDGVLHVGSRTGWKKDAPSVPWWTAARAHGLADVLAALPANVVLYGESYGYTGGFLYGAQTRKPRFRAFDLFDAQAGRYLDYADFESAIVGRAPIAPVVYRGPFDFDRIAALAEEDSEVDGAGGIREGVVVRPARERFDPTVGRVILKLHSQRYLLRKGA